MSVGVQHRDADALSRAISHQAADGWRMRSVLRGIQALWKRPVALRLCGLLPAVLMISSARAQSLSNPHRNNTWTHHITAGDSLWKELLNVYMLISERNDSCGKKSKILECELLIKPNFISFSSLSSCLSSVCITRKTIYFGSRL